LVVKRERLKHMEAYEYYFITGGFLSKKSIKKTMKKMDIGRGSNFYKYVGEMSGRRSILKVAKRFNVSRTAVYNWCRSFNWKERVRERDKEINKRVFELDKG